MRIEVKVQPNAKHEGVEVLGPRHLKVRTKAPPREGKANEAVVKMVAEHFGVAKSLVRLVHGESSRTKLLEVQIDA